MRLPLAVLLTSVLLACPADPDDDATTPAEVACGGAEEVVHFTTEDGETLEADWWPAGTANAGAVVLLHMIPPSNDRSGYPGHVRAAFHDLGVSVLNVDRRGAGGSTGDATAAYEGAGGRLDAEAAVRFLLDPKQACPADGSKLVLVGASNGTTSVYDYLVGHDAALPRAAAVIFMSPGGYTENQNPMPTDPAGILALDRPLLWLFPTNEPYSTAFMPDAPDAWRFVENGTQHGTRMFDGGALETSTVAEMTAWISAAR